MDTKIKICGLTRREDVEAVNALRPDYVGFVLAPSKRRVSLQTAVDLSRYLHPDILPVGVFVNETVEQIERSVRTGAIRAVQLHGEESIETVRILKEVLPPDVPVIKAVRMDKQSAFECWRDSMADFLLLDAGKGGGGVPFDHSLLEAAENIPKPWFLAGGMNPENGRELAERFVPYGIDVSSGVETDGKKDPEKIERMMRRMRDE